MKKTSAFGLILFGTVLVFLANPMRSFPDEKTGLSVKKQGNTPNDVVATYNRALAERDWYTCLRCFTPAQRGDWLSRILFAAAVSADRELLEIAREARPMEACLVKRGHAKAHPPLRPRKEFVPSTTFVELTASGT